MAGSLLRMRMRLRLRLRLMMVASVVRVCFVAQLQLQLCGHANVKADARQGDETRREATPQRQMQHSDRRNNKT